jgi:hypothetical protein
MTSDKFEEFQKHIRQKNITFFQSEHLKGELVAFPELTDEERKKDMVGTFSHPSFCSELCGYLNYTEEEQNKLKNKPNHICLKYNKRLKHLQYHPKIVRCDECIKEGTVP